MFYKVEYILSAFCMSVCICVCIVSTCMEKMKENSRETWKFEQKETRLGSVKPLVTGDCTGRGWTSWPNWSLRCLGGVGAADSLAFLFLSFTVCRYEIFPLGARRSKESTIREQHLYLYRLSWILKDITWTWWWCVWGSQKAIYPGRNSLWKLRASLCEAQTALRTSFFNWKN